MTRSHPELLYLLGEQLLFIERSSEAYDNGVHVEAKRIAVALRNIFHDSKHSYSLLGQLGLRDSRMWVDTAGVVDPLNEAGTLTALVKLQLNFKSGPTFLPRLDSTGTDIRRSNGDMIPRGSLIPFDDWWTKPVIKDAHGTEVSRRHLVLMVADKEGGAHVDRASDPDFEALARNGSLGYGWSMAAGPGGWPLLADPILPSIRSVAYEVLESILRDPPAGLNVN